MSISRKKGEFLTEEILEAENILVSKKPSYKFTRKGLFTLRKAYFAELVAENDKKEESEKLSEKEIAELKELYLSEEF